ncbi:uncharacterized protein LOC144448942 [Glandiceps talaboti]
MLGKGVKRKYHELEEEKEMGFANLYSEQRQSFLNISLHKLRSCQNVTEPKLLRSVLICNTLKQIEKELQMENTGMIYGGRGLSPPPYISKNTDSMEIPTKEESQRAFNKCSVTTETKVKSQDEDKENVCSEKMTCRQYNNVSRTKKDSATCESTDLSMDIEKIEPLSPLGTCETSDASEKHETCRTETDVKTVNNNNNCERESNCTDIESIDSTLSLLEAGEEEFGDIDVSLYDFDLFTPISPKSTEEVWKVNATTDSTSISNLCPTTSCRSDILDDIDQIMNVLIEVGM